MAGLQLSSAATPTARLPYFDELKGLAIIFILIYHVGGVLVWRNYFHGDVGVDIFLLLSGAGLSFSAKTESANQFVRRRFVRLFPAYWLVLLLFVVCNTHFLQHRYSWANLAAHVTGMHVAFGDQIGLSINDSFWFVSAITFLYAAYWCLRPLLQAPDRFIFWAGLISASVAFAYFFTGQAGLMGHVGFRTPAFFAGVLAGHFLKQGRIDLPATWWSGIGLLFFAYVPYTCGITFFSTFVALALIAAYVWALRPTLSADGAVVRTLSNAGGLSFELFLLHQPLIREYNYYLHGRWLNVASPSTLSLSVGIVLGLTVAVMLSVELQRLQRLVFRT